MIFILAAFMVLTTSACTSKKASDEADVEQSSSGDEGIEAADATDNSDDLSVDKPADGGAVADMGGADDLAPEEKLDGDKAAPPSDTVAADPGAPADPGATDTPPPPPDAAQAGNDAALPPAEPATDTPPPPPVAEATPAEPMAPPAEPVAQEAKPVASLQKIKSTPYKQGKILVNAVYIARKGDTPESISQKVFGTKDKEKEICKVNSYNCSRPTKVGDKFYYNSPQRPTDDQVVKTFYEDANVPAQTYTAKAGDNIRKVGKELLGDDRSWQELWATNDVESKQGLDEGTKLKYWPDTAGGPAQTMAKTEDGATPPPDAAAGATPPPGGEAAAPPPGDQAATPPPPPDAGAQPPGQQAAATPPPPPDALPPAPPPPDQNQQAAAAAPGTVEPPAPPPPPPPPDQASNKQPAGVAADAGQDPNQTMALGVGAVLLLAAAALFISIRKKRARRQIDFNTTTQTQIE